MLDMSNGEASMGSCCGVTSCVRFGVFKCFIFGIPWSLKTWCSPTWSWVWGQNLMFWSVSLCIVSTSDGHHFFLFSPSLTKQLSKKLKFLEGTSKLVFSCMSLEFTSTSFSRGFWSLIEDYLLPSEPQEELDECGWQEEEQDCWECFVFGSYKIKSMVLISSNSLNHKEKKS